MTGQTATAVEKNNRSVGFVKSALILSLGGLLAKIIGAAYRIPLTGLIGSEGIGLYQTVFPVYTALLTLSSSGLPVAISKMISGKDKGNGVLLKCLMFYGALGFVFSALMFVLGDFLGKLQGAEQAGACYKALSPSVFLVSAIACFRGYFQGKGNNFPTAFSQITEQIVKASFGLFCCKYFGKTVSEKAFFAVLAVSASELVALGFLIVKYVSYKRKNKKREGGGCTKPTEYIEACGENTAAAISTEKQGENERVRRKKATLKEILKVTVPVAFCSMALPLGHIADSFIVLNLLKRGGENAESLFGLYSGCVPAVTGVPVAIAFGAAASAVPLISSKEENGRLFLPDIMRFTGFVAIPSALYLALFSRNIVSFLYGSLSSAEADVAAKLLTAKAIEVILLSFLQSTNACLIALGKQKKTVSAMYAGLAVKVVVCFTSIFFFRFGIFGGVAGEVVSLSVSLFMCVAFLGNDRKLPTVLYDFSKELMLSLICVLWGFYLNSMLKGNMSFVLVSLSVALFYLSFSVALFGKRGLKIRSSRGDKSI